MTVLAAGAPPCPGGGGGCLWGSRPYFGGPNVLWPSLRGCERRSFSGISGWMGVSTLGHPETQKPPLGGTSQQHRSFVVSCLPRQALPRKASGHVPGPGGPQGLGSTSEACLDPAHLLQEPCAGTQRSDSGGPHAAAWRGAFSPRWSPLSPASRQRLWLSASAWITRGPGSLGGRLVPPPRLAWVSLGRPRTPSSHGKGGALLGTLGVRPDALTCPRFGSRAHLGGWDPPWGCEWPALESRPGLFTCINVNPTAT